MSHRVRDDEEQQQQQADEALPLLSDTTQEAERGEEGEHEGEGNRLYHDHHHQHRPQRNRTLSTSSLQEGSQRGSRRDRKLAKKLYVASEALLDRLFSYLSSLPDDEPGPSSSSQRRNSSSSSSCDSRRTGITLPASAIGWLASQIYGTDSSEDDSLFVSEEDDDDDTDLLENSQLLSASVHDRVSLLRYLLPRQRFLRINADPWPNKLKKSLKATNNNNHSTQDDDSSTEFRELHYHNLLYRPCVDLRLFPNLQVLILDQVPPEWVLHLASLRDLQVLRIEQSGICNLPQLFYGTTTTRTDGATDGATETNNNNNHPRVHDLLLLQDESLERSSSWFFPKLKLLKISHCSLTSQALGNTTTPSSSSSSSCCPLSRLTHLQAVSLAHNDLAQSAPVLRALRNKPFLSKLDLSYNQLGGSLRLAPLCLGNLQSLCLSHNRIVSTRNSIDRLYSLETLWLDYNQIPDIAAIAGLARLALLTDLKLRGNPLETSQNSLQKAYRVHVLDLFLQQRLPFLSRDAALTFGQMQSALPRLDDELASIGEMKALKERVFTFVSLTPTPPCTTTFNTTNTTTSSRPNDDDEFVLVEERQSSFKNNKQQHQQRHRRRLRKVARIDNNDMEPSGKVLVAVDRRKPDPNYIPPTKFTVADVLECISAAAAKNESLSTEVDEQEGAQGRCQDDAERSHTSNDAEQQKASMKESATDVVTSSDQKMQQLSPFDNALGPIVKESAWVFPTMSSTEPNQGLVTEAKWQAENDDLLSAPSVNDSQLEKDLGTASLSPIPHALKSSEATTEASTAADTSADIDLPETPATSIRLAGKEEDDLKPESSKPSPSTPEDPDIANTERSNSPEGDQLPIRVVSSLWQDDSSVATSVGKSSSTFDETTAQQKYVLAEDNSVFNVNTYMRLNVLDNLELYFELFVFNYSMLPSVLPSSPDKNNNDWVSVLERYPKIQMWPLDRRMREAYEEKAQMAGKDPESTEELRRVWKERVVACGKPALRRLTPNRGARFGFHGELLWSAASTSHIKPETIAEHREVLICMSNTSIYFIADHDSVSSRIIANDPNRKFPLPVPKDATFEQAKWPHAMAWHPFHTLTGITIGFGFQRLTLRFSNSTFPSPDDFTYILLTSNKLETVRLLKEIQSLASEARAGMAGSSKPFYNNNAMATGGFERAFNNNNMMMAPDEDAIKIDNDDRHVLDALGVAVAPDVIGAVLHYQILSQYWRHGDRGAVRRVCVVTDTTVYLLDEDYVGDGSESLEAGYHRMLGETTYRVVDSAPLTLISVVKAADADPCAMTMSIRATSRLSRTHNWRLTCRDRHGAEQLVEDLRKAIAMTVG